MKFLAYCASKGALNMLTVELAYEFRDGSIAVNSVNPGYTATDLNHNSGNQTIEEGVVEIVPDRTSRRTRDWEIYGDRR